MKALEIFKPGTHVARNGKPYTFTEGDLAAVAKAYDPARHEAPLVVGHPKSDAPAYGWVKTLAVHDGALCADSDQVEPQFAELVRTGRFKKRSAAFYAPDDPQNPTPGQWHLRHVGFLGAQPPAVKGLRDAQFSASDTAIEFMDWSQRDIASIFRGIRDFFIEKFGKDEADKAIPSYMVDSIQEDAVKTASPAISYEEHDLKTKEQEELERKEAELKAGQEKLERERAEFAEREAKLKANETAAARATRSRECAEFVDAQVKEGRVLPAQRDGLVAFMAALPAEGVVEFGEGDKAVKKPGAEWLRDYLKAQPKVVDFQERAGGELPKDMTAEQLAAKAVEFQEAEQKAGREISITAAVTHIKNQAAR